MGFVILARDEIYALIEHSSWCKDLSLPLLKYFPLLLQVIKLLTYKHTSSVDSIIGDMKMFGVMW